jgi:hypothetical protein
MTKPITHGTVFPSAEADFEKRIKALELASASASLLVPEDVHFIGAAGQPAFGTNWVNYGAAWLEPSFFRHLGIVYLRGLIKKTTAPVVNDVLFILPVGWRPVKDEIFTVAAGNDAGNDQGRVDVRADGVVQWKAGVSAGTNPFVSLAAIIFRHA